MQLKHAAVRAVIATALVATAGPAHAESDSRSGDTVKPVMKYAEVAVRACRGRSGGFSTATFTAVNRGESRAFAKAWADNGYHAEIGSRRLNEGEWAELGEFGTTGSTVEVEFHLVIRVNGQTRTSVFFGRDLPKC
ncbi:hypothetical protein [Nocardioides sp. P5_C9_2]